MNIEQHVPKLETCQKLQEAGWKQQTYFKWVKTKYGWRPCEEWRVASVTLLSMDTYKSPLLSELLEHIPSVVELEGCLYYLVMDNDGRRYAFYYDQYWEPTKDDFHQNPAEAAAQLVLTLVEEGVLTL